jgi:hypothetical protein
VNETATSPDFDVFVSYKSDDVMVVRPVANALMAAGARVWFAEHQVLIADRERFQERIDDGIRRSARGVVFTNNRFVGSQYCRRELDQLLEVAGPGNVVEVLLPGEEAPHREYPALGESEAIDSSDREEIGQLLAARLGVRLAERPRPRRRGYRDAAGRHAGTRGQPQAFEGELLGRPYRIALDGWAIEKDPATDERYSGMLPEFKYAVKWPPLFVNLACGPDVAPEAERFQEVEGDRAVYEYLLEYAPRHLEAIGADVRGVHLLLKDGRSQMGLTYLNQDIWTRKVSVIVPNPAVSAMGEFVFTFGLFGSFEEYCLMASTMDDLAMSVSWS